MELHLWFIGISTIIFILLVWFSLAQEKKRSEHLRRTAMLLGFSFRPADKKLQLGPFTSLPLFQRGRRRRFRNILEAGSGDARTLIFDYSFHVSSGKRGRTHVQTAACFPFQKGDAAFQLSPETIIDRVKSTFGYHDINFESQPEFSRNYNLSGSDEAAVSGLFKDTVLYYFREKEGWTLECGGGWLAVYKKDERTRLEEYRFFVEDVREIRRLFA